MACMAWRQWWEGGRGSPPSSYLSLHASARTHCSMRLPARKGRGKGEAGRAKGAYAIWEGGRNRNRQTGQGRQEVEKGQTCGAVAWEVRRKWRGKDACGEEKGHPTGRHGISSSLTSLLSLSSHLSPLTLTSLSKHAGNFLTLTLLPHLTLTCLPISISQELSLFASGRNWHGGMAWPGIFAVSLPSPSPCNNLSPPGQAHFGTLHHLSQFLFCLHTCMAIPFSSIPSIPSIQTVDWLTLCFFPGSDCGCGVWWCVGREEFSLDTPPTCHLFSLLPGTILVGWDIVFVPGQAA